MDNFIKQASLWLQAISDKMHKLGFPSGNGSPLGILRLPMSDLIFIIFGVVLLLSVTILYQYRGKLDLRERLKLTRELMAGLHSSGRLEDNLMHILSQVSQIIVAPYYAFYVWDTRADRYVLRAVSHPYDAFEGVGPAYSGLALPKKEAYLPPSTLEAPGTDTPFLITKDGDVSMLVVRIGRTRGLMRVGPVRAINRRQRRYVTEFSSLLETPLDEWINLESDRVKQELSTLTDAAIHKVAGLASNVFGTLSVLLDAFTGIVGGKGGIFIERTEDGTTRLHANDALSRGIAELETDEAGISGLENLVADGTEAIVSRMDSEFYDLPVALTSHGDVGAVVIIPFDSLGTLVMLHDDHFDLNEWQTVGRERMGYLTDQVKRMIAQGATQRTLVKGYTRLLCQIADMVDNLNPYTVGYSDMMTRYSLVVGKEMGLSDSEMRDLALAARLSNIGVVGMDMRLLTKEGKYSDFEYSLMKRHAEISASMIELVTGNRRAAQYVLCHHERVDGYGYPAGLEGNQIPVGAKIIHGVQAFLAKVNGRSWRVPLSFDVAMRELRNAVGTSLDEKVVSAFESWWMTQAKRPDSKGNNLGKCHEMCCVPKTICQSCPAFQSPLRCWEMPDNHCKSHGRDCEICFVRTEFLYRTRLLTESQV